MRAGPVTSRRAHGIAARHGFHVSDLMKVGAVRTTTSAPAASRARYGPFGRSCARVDGPEYSRGCVIAASIVPRRGPVRLAKAWPRPATGSRPGRREALVRAAGPPFQRLGYPPRDAHGHRPDRHPVPGTRCSARSGYLGVLLAMAIESAMIPLPSELILPFAGVSHLGPREDTEPLTNGPWRLLEIVVPWLPRSGNTLGSPHRRLRDPGRIGAASVLERYAGSRRYS